MAGEIQRPQEKAESDSLALPYGLERVEGAKQKAEERWARIPIHAEPPQALDDPRAAPEAPEIFPDRLERPDDVEVIDGNKLGVRPLKKHELAIGEQLQGAAEFRSPATGALGHAGEFSELSRVKGDELVRLADGAASDRDRPALLDPHYVTRRGARPTAPFNLAVKRPREAELPPKLARAKPPLEQNENRAKRCKISSLLGIATERF